MKIILGQELDGNVYRALPEGSAETGTLTAGTAGFLDALELSLGIPEKRPSHLRVFQYERALGDALDGESFYAGSFRTDPYGASDMLLKARDEILLSAPSSFSFAATGVSGGRIGTLARVEERFRSMNPDPGVPERLRTVLSLLKRRRIRTGIDEIVLVDALESWHVLFRELIAELASCGREISSFTPAYPVHDGDLGAMLGHLRETDGRKAGPGAAPAEDGSLFLVRAPGVLETADFLAMLTAPLLEQGEKVLLIHGGLSEEPSRAFIRRGLPSPGGEIRSLGLPLLQVLPLYLSLQFSPLDPETLLRYLGLPLSPLPENLRVRLLKAFIALPGTGSSRWKSALDGFTSGSGDGRAARLIRSWLSFENVPETRGLPFSRLDEICSEYTGWLEEKRLSADDREESARAHGLLQAELFRTVAKLRGWTELTPERLAALKRDTGRAFQVTVKSAPEAGSPFLVSSPAAVLSPADTVIYWNFSEKAVPVPSRNIFSSEERKMLSGRGVEFLTPESLYRSHLQAVVRAAASARRRVYLVCPERADGEPVNLHPLWYRMLKAFPEESRAERRLCLRSSAWLAGAAVGAAGSASDVPVPEPCGKKAAFSILTTPRAALPLPERVSPSLLEPFLDCPLSYVLTYAAHLRPPETELPAGGLLYGRIAHNVIEACLGKDRELADIGSFRQTIEKEAADYIRRSAAMLVCDGMDRERDWVIRKIVEGGTALARALSRGGYRVLEIEKGMRKDLEGFTVEGFADLVVERTATGKKAVIDMKWSREKDFRDLLTRGINVQTAAYSFLLGEVPSAYFIIETGRFITVHHGLFPDADVVEGPDEGSVWEQTAGFITARREALLAGRIELGQPDKRWKEELKEGRRAFFAPAPCRFCVHRTFCGVEEA